MQLYLKVVLVLNQAVIQLSAQQLRQKVVEVVVTHTLILRVVLTHNFQALNYQMDCLVVLVVVVDMLKG